MFFVLFLNISFLFSATIDTLKFTNSFVSSLSICFGRHWERCFKHVDMKASCHPRNMARTQQPTERKPMQNANGLTENGNKCICNTVTTQHIHSTSCVKEFYILLDCSSQVDAMDSIITIGSDLDPFIINSIMITSIYSKIKHNCNVIGCITMLIDVYDIFCEITSVFNILIKFSILVLLSDALTNAIIRTNLKLDEVSEFRYSCNNTTSITTIVNFNIRSGFTRTATFCLAATCLIEKIIKTLPSIITVSIECDANGISVAQLVLNSTACLSIDAVSCHTQ